MSDHGAEHHAHGHSHDHARTEVKSSGNILVRLGICLGLNLAMFVVGLIAWVISGSIAVLSDSSENAVHGFVALMTLLGIYFANRPATDLKTYGYKRLNVYIPAVNALILAAVGFAFVGVGIKRAIFPPEEIIGLFMLIVPTVDLAQNAFQIFILRGHGNVLSIRAMFYHLRSDSLMSLGVIAGGFAVYFADFNRADGIAAAGVGLLSIYWAYKILKRALPALLDWWPEEDVSRDEIETYYLSFPEITAIHELHGRYISIDPTIIGINVHAVSSTTDFTILNKIRAQIQRELKQKFGVTHSFLQWEDKECAFEQEI